MPFCLPRLTASARPHGENTSQYDDNPNPHFAYISRFSSTWTVRFAGTFTSKPSGAGSDATQASVSAWLECDTAIKDISGFAMARERRSRKDFSATRHALAFSIHEEY